MKHAIVTAKIFVILSLLCLLSTTYFLRSRLLDLVDHLIDGQNVQAQERMDRFRASEEDRQAEYDAALSRFETGKERFRSLLELYQEDLEAYREQTNEGKVTQPPPSPQKPHPPSAPATQQQLAEIHQEFREARTRYFALASGLNSLVGIFSLLLVGGLVFLIFFETSGPRAVYVVILGLSFVFLIGPALHSALTFVAYDLRPPTYTSGVLLR